MSTKLRLGTKAETLKALEASLTGARVLPQVSFTTGQWQEEEMRLTEAAERLRLASDSKRLIVRSSALDEDMDTSSQAGKYLSVPGVSGEKELQDAVRRVMASYGDANSANQVLIQPELTGVRYCGVAFTMDPNTAGHYYVIDFDTTGSTSAITSGEAGTHVLYYLHKSRAGKVQEADENRPEPYARELNRLCMVLKELEELFDQSNLDIEFAFDEEKELYIFQTRALVLAHESVDFTRQTGELNRIQEKIRREQRPKPFLCGEKAIYSVMTDWNPAEMIGIRPKQLALSLYQEIITDSIWAYQRDNYGYRNLRSVPLMVDFGGMPYIDVRASFNSFVPAELSAELSEKLVNYYLKRLSENPLEHDKAEFHIVFSCYTFDLPERIRILDQYGFSEAEIAQIMDALRNVTNRIIDHETGLWRKDQEKIETLSRRYEMIMNSDMSRIEKVYWLLEDCKRYGTLPFAGLARAAFIAVQILKSMVTCGILSEMDYEAFMNGVHTISSRMNADLRELSRDAFLRRYGHLRPGTYDITSPRYDEAPDLYFDWESCKSTGEEKKTPFRLSIDQMNHLKKLLEENGLTNDILSLLEFIRAVIEGREYGKFVFTKNVSQAIRLIGEIGAEEGFAVEDCAHINVRIFQRLYASAEDVKTAYADSIALGKRKYAMTKAMILPPVILTPEDATGFFYPDSEPNFITMGRVTGEVLVLEKMDQKLDLSGKIVLIEGADPGFDWIFSHKVKGFITMYGGANSHMAIRAGELFVPAAVGAGAKLFESCKKAKTIELDAQAKTIRIIR